MVVMWGEGAVALVAGRSTRPALAAVRARTHTRTRCRSPLKEEALSMDRYYVREGGSRDATKTAESTKCLSLRPITLLNSIFLSIEKYFFMN